MCKNGYRFQNTLSSLSAHGWCSVPALLAVWPEVSQLCNFQAIEWGKVLMSKWQPPGELTLMNTHWYLHLQCPVHSEPQSTSHIPRRLSRTLRCIWPRLLWRLIFTAFSLRPGAHESLCVPSKSGVSIFLSPVEFLQSFPAGLQSHCSWGPSSQCQTLRLRHLFWGSEFSLLWENSVM